MPGGIGCSERQLAGDHFLDREAAPAQVHAQMNPEYGVDQICLAINPVTDPSDTSGSLRKKSALN
jgi:hypothetical protein